MTHQQAIRTNDEVVFHQKMLRVFSCASGLAILLAFAILMIGIFVGPIWLIALSVFVGFCSVLCIAYVFTSRYKYSNRVHGHSGDGRSRRGQWRDTGHDHFDGFGPPFCIYNMKLPTYEETIQNSTTLQPTQGKFIFTASVLDKNLIELPTNYNRSRKI